MTVNQLSTLKAPRRSGLGLLSIFVCGCSIACNAPTGSDLHELSIQPRLTRLLSIDNELVFAYSRVSPDGSLLAYSSEPDSGMPLSPGNQKLRVYNVKTHNVLYEDRGIDGYWSPDGDALVYKAKFRDTYSVSIWNRRSGEISRDVISTSLGDYYSWGADDQRDTLLTIDGWFVSIADNHAVSEPQRIPECNGIGRGDRPLISRDGRRVSVFVDDELVLRNLRDCSDIVRTGIVAAKADWSQNGRFLAFHTAKNSNEGYDIGILDRLTFAFRRLALSGSTYFPSWTDDNALIFRYQGPEYQGFMRADGVLDAPIENALAANHLQDRGYVYQQWKSVLPAAHTVIVLLWSSWSAHTADALREFSSGAFNCPTPDCRRVAAFDPSSPAKDVERVLSGFKWPFATVRAPWRALVAAGGINQSPTYLLFHDGCLAARALGAHSATELQSWVSNGLQRREYIRQFCYRKGMADILARDSILN